jgi:hypothetical protein
MHALLLLRPDDTLTRTPIDEAVRCPRQLTPHAAAATHAPCTAAPRRQPLYVKLLGSHVFGLGFMTSVAFITLTGMFFSSWLGRWGCPRHVCRLESCNGAGGWQ